RRVEVVGHGPALQRGPERDAPLFLELAPERDEVLEDVVEPPPVRRTDAELDRGEIAHGLADVEAVELVGAAVLDDDVEVLRHHPGVDEVPRGGQTAGVHRMPIPSLASATACFTFATFSFTVADALREIS